MQRRRRPCLVCGTLTRNPSRCDVDQARWEAARDAARGSATARGYGSQYQRAAAQVLAAHRAEHGDWCPGWRRAGHWTEDLTADHIIPVSQGGGPGAANLRVLCRSCNSARGNSS